MHLVAAPGSTLREVEARFPVSERVPMSPPEDTQRGMAHAVAAGELDELPRRDGHRATVAGAFPEEGS